MALPGAAGAAMLSKVGDFAAPTYVTAPPGDPHRLFVVEEGGTIQVLHDGVKKQFVDLSREITSTPERGLLSMAFAPDYAKSGLFYIFYTAPRDPSTGDMAGDVLTIAELRRSANDPDRADPTSRRTVIGIDHPNYSDHDGGQLQFGPDGYLYIATGDGGGANDQNGNPATGNAQDTDVLLGKLLRIDPRRTATTSYGVPTDNPFVHRAGADQVYAYGLRNPWRFSFDRLTGDLVIGDVGQKTREEVDFAPRGTGAGANYGWRCREGFMATSNSCPTGLTFADPVFDYGHTASACSGAVTGGYVVRNHDLNSLYGRYVYVDFCGRGDIRSLVLAKPHAIYDSSTGLVRRYIDSFGEDSCGHLYTAARTGEVDVVVDSAFTPCREPPVQDVTAPRLSLTSDRRQHLRDHRSLYVKVRCDERCGVTGSARISVPPGARVFAVPRVSRSLAARRKVTLRLLLTESSARVARRALRAHHRVHATLEVVARDAAGNQTVATRRVRVLL